MEKAFENDLKIINSISAIPAILDIICTTTGMGYATVARVTSERWIACAVLDNINFGLPVGGELKVETTLCNEVHLYHKAIVIDDFAIDPEYANHHTPKMYGLRSYISIPITLQNGRFFGTLCAIDPRPAKVNNPGIIRMFNLYAELIALHIDNWERLEAAETKLAEEQRIAELREQFIAILGHDLRNPVGAVRNVGQLLKSGRLDEKGIEKFAGVLLNSSHRMTGLIENLMDFGRGRLGDGIVLNRSLTYLEEPLQHVVEELRLIWPDKIILTDISLTSEVFADPKRISQLLSNLLSNAIVHGEQGQPIRVVLDSANGNFFLSVKNNGKPIPDTIKSKIFEPFSRGIQNGQQEGLGLGLYISSEIAKAHDSTLELHSEDNVIEFKLNIFKSQ